MYLVVGDTAALVQQQTVETSQVLAWWFRRAGARLQLNGVKTHFMFLVSPQRKATGQLEGGFLLPRGLVEQSKEKLLGVTFTSTMSLMSMILHGN